MLGGYAHSRVVNVDSDVVLDAPTADQDAPIRLRILDGVAHQIAQDAFEKDGVAHDHRTRRMHAQLDAVFQRVALVLLRDAPKQRRQRNRRNFHPLDVLIVAQRAHQPVELLGQPGDGSLASRQTDLLGGVGDAAAQPFVGALLFRCSRPFRVELPESRSCVGGPSPRSCRLFVHSGVARS